MLPPRVSSIDGRGCSIRSAPAGPPSVCSLRFAPLRARGATDGTLRRVKPVASSARARFVVGVSVSGCDLGPSKSAGLRFAAQHPRQPPVIHDRRGSRLTRILRHGARSPADLLGAGGLMRTRSRQQLERDILLSQRAHEMRSNATRSESALWAALSRVQLGVAFRRQVPIGNRYMADFVAPAVRLIIEVDGAYHRRRATADARRTRVLERLGYRVLRLDAEVVLR